MFNTVENFGEKASILTLSSIQVRSGAYMAGTIRSDVGKKNQCPCGGKFVSTENDQYQHKVPLCEKCGKAPRLLKVRIVLPALSKVDIRYNLKGTRLTTLALADAFLIDVHDEIRTGTFNPINYLSPKKRDLFKIKHLIDEYEAEKIRNKGIEKGCSPGFLRTIRTLKKHYLIPFFGEMDVREIRFRHLDAFLRSNKFKSERQKVKALQMLRPILRRACKIVDGMTMPEFPVLKRPKMKTTFIDFETQQLIFSKVVRYREAMEFALIYLLRPCEVTAIQHGDIDRKRKVITIQRHWSDNELIAGRKSAVDQNDRYHKLELPFVPRIEEIIRAVPVSFDRGEFFFKGPRGKGRPVNHNALNNEWKRACKLAGVPVCSFYESTRHAGASQLLNQGISKDQIRALCGHTTSQTTDRYAMADTLTLGAIIQHDRKGAERGRINEK